MKQSHNIAKTTGIIGLGTLLSRITGFIRDVLIASFFGTSLSSDVFFVAFRIPNLLRRLFAEGSLSIAFIPVFTEHIAKHGQKEAFELACSTIKVLAVILIFVTGLGIIFSSEIIWLITPGFKASPEKFQLTVYLTQIMFPYAFFICLAAVLMGILNTLGHFAAPAIAPMFLNLSMIGAIIFMASSSFKKLDFKEPIVVLAIGVLIGGALQLLIQIPFLIKKKFYFWQKSKFFHSGLKKIGKLMIPAAFGAAVYQINLLISTLLASLLPEGSVSYLYYADRIVEFPLGIFGIATATAVLPSFSKQAALKDFQSLKDTFVSSINFLSFITVPASIGLIVLREPIVELLFKRGLFNAQSVSLTADALFYYSLGLWAFSTVKIAVSVFYALQDTKTPVKIAFISIIINTLLGFILIKYLKHSGLALATSLASMANFILLYYFLAKRLGGLNSKNILLSGLKSCFCSVLMGVIIYFAAFLFAKNLIYVVLNIFIGIIFYFLTSFLFNKSELQKLMKF